MNSNRLKMLEKFMEEEPDDPFPVYALALEHLPVDQQKAKQLFDRLLDQHPDYIPTYYHAGNLYWTEGNPEKAIRILEKGITISRTAGDTKTTQEIQGLLDTLL